MGILAVRPNSKDLAAVTELVVAGTLECVIDRRYSLRDTSMPIRHPRLGGTLAEELTEVMAQASDRIRVK